MIFNLIFRLFKLPLIRHLIAGAAIIFAIHYLAIKPIQKENNRLHKQINSQRTEFIHLTNKALDRATNEINNHFDKVKSGKKAEPIVLSIDNQALLITDSLQTNKREKKRGFFKRLFGK